MDPEDQSPNSKELPPKAQRVIRLIYVAMAFMILLPLVLVWLTGTLRF